MKRKPDGDASTVAAPRTTDIVAESLTGESLTVDAANRCSAVGQCRHVTRGMASLAFAHLSGF